LFEKVEDEVIDRQIQKLLDKKAATQPQKQIETAPAKENINYESFASDGYPHGHHFNRGKGGPKQKNCSNLPLIPASISASLYPALPNILNPKRSSAKRYAFWQTLNRAK